MLSPLRSLSEKNACKHSSSLIVCVHRYPLTMSAIQPIQPWPWPLPAVWLSLSIARCCSECMYSFVGMGKDRCIKLSVVVDKCWHSKHWTWLISLPSKMSLMALVYTGFGALFSLFRLCPFLSLDFVWLLTEIELFPSAASRKLSEKSLWLELVLWQLPLAMAVSKESADSLSPSVFAVWVEPGWLRI